MTERDALDESVFDVALTGDESFIESARSLQTPPAFRPDGNRPSVVVTQWTSRYGPVQFDRSGDRMQGPYEDGQSRISGTVRGKCAGRHLVQDACRTPVRHGTDGHPRHWGRLRFTFVTNERFEGAWRYCDADPSRNWKGERVRED